MAEAVTLGSVAFGVAQLAVDLTVRGVTGKHRVQRAMALTAVVAGLVPFLKGQGDTLPTQLFTPFSLPWRKCTDSLKSFVGIFGEC